MDIKDWREKIDDIDLLILRLLNERAQCSIEIGKIKKAKKMSIHVPDREKSILARIARKNTGPLSNEGVCRLFERIIDESRKLQRDLLYAKGNKEV